MTEQSIYSIMKKFYQITTSVFIALLALTLTLRTATAGVISSNSMINITIKAVPVEEQQRIAGSYTVDGRGYVSLPFLSDTPIKASGLTGSTLSRKIEAAYKNAQIYSAPLINVTTAKDIANEQIDNKIVSVGGYVKAPGPKPYQRGMTLFQAVTAAGGANAYGASNRTELIRNGKKYIYNMKNTKDMQLLVYPNDTINVPQKKWNGR